MTEEEYEKFTRELEDELFGKSEDETQRRTNPG